MKNYQFNLVEGYHARGAMPSIVGASTIIPYGGGGSLSATVDRKSTGSEAVEVHIKTMMQIMKLMITADRARELEDFFRLVRTHLDAGGK